MILRKLYFLNLFIYLFLHFRVTSAAYGGSQSRGQIGALAAGLGHSLSTRDLSHI